MRLPVLITDQKSPATLVPWRIVPGGLALDARVTPKSAVDAVTGLHDDGERPRLSIAVRAIPDKGAANAAVAATVARWLGVPKSSVRVTSGAKSRAKSMLIDGDPATLSALIDAKLSGIFPSET